VRCLVLALLAEGIALVPFLRGAGGASASVPISEQARAATQWTLHIEGLRLPPGKSGIVEVYASRGDAASETATEQANYVGYIAPVPRNSREAERGVVVKGAILDLTPKLDALKSGKQIRITLVQPSREPSKEGNEDQKPTWDRIYITFK
jgi:hypothetical protein